jgi:dTDP-4-amino-4,6-dideoxygalactose transaminase
VDEHLQVDIEDFKGKCTQYSRPLILLVHYFGLVDKQYDYLVDWLDDKNYFFVEDCAHAMLSDLIGGRCGRRGRYSLYSLHKMLPLDSGGILVNNRPSSQTLAVQSFAACTLDYDLYEIGKARRRNYKLLAGLLNNVSGLTLIEPTLKDGIYPQTLPVIIESDRRDQLYFEMNEKGFGVVSLYHTMIDELKDSKSPAATYTSKHIMNLPVHQDASKEALTIFAEQFKAAL